MQNQIVQDKLQILPDNPGCYLMKNQQGTLIYVGKAKVLKKRVMSYFIGAHSGKVQKMIEEIADFELIITKNEAEALILESQLVKAHQPRYNILLKDDKSYPYIALTQEAHPRLILTRQPQKKYKMLFGPYVSASEVRTTIEILNYIYPFRKCLKLPKKLCLYYHIKQCLGPCVYPIDTAIYKQYIQEIGDFLRGNPRQIKGLLIDKMNTAADRLEYEQAGIYRNMIATIETLFEKKGNHQAITEDTDVIGYAYNDTYIAVQIFHLRNGSIVERESDVFVYEESDIIAIIESYMYQFYQSKHVLTPQVIYVVEHIATDTLKMAFEYTSFMTPKRGAKKELLQFAMDNAQKALEQKALLAQNRYNMTIGAVDTLGNLLAIAAPTTMEMIDTANLQSSSIVSGVVVFINGIPSKKDYRKYKIKSTVTQDDYQALREVVYRRFYRKLIENHRLPNLLVVDGGIGHIHVAVEVLQSLNVQVPVIGLSKNKQHRTEAIVTADGNKIKMKTTDPLFKMLSHMQEEVHRFVIDYHRQKRTSSAFSSELLHINGVGESTRKKLLNYFPHIDQLKKASLVELEQVVSTKIAANIFAYFHSEPKGGT